MRIIYSNKIVSITILTALLITGFIIIQPFYIHAQKETATNIPDPIKVTKCQVVNPPTDPYRYEHCYFQGCYKNYSCLKRNFQMYNKEWCSSNSGGKSFYRTI